MKLKYKKGESLSPKTKGKGWLRNKYITPDSYINNFSEAKEFFNTLFADKSHVKDIEFVDIGDKFLIRAKFWRGPFNESPIKFALESSYSKKFETHQLLNAVIGACAQNSAYFLNIKDSEIKIDKQMEVLG